MFSFLVYFFLVHHAQGSDLIYPPTFYLGWAYNVLRKLAVEETFSPWLMLEVYPASLNSGFKALQESMNEIKIF